MKTPPTINMYCGDELVQVVGPDAPLATPKKMWKTGNGCIDHILNEGHFQPMMESPELPKCRENWRTQLRAACLTPPADAELSSAFHTRWHVCHSRLRELVDDDDLMFDLMWAWLPKYDGPDQTLYRGESIDRFQAENIGSAWSPNEKTATMFARGPNAVGQGGMILRATVPAALIIAGPSKHSADWLGESEFSVDTRKLTGIETIARFPSSGR